MKKPIIPPKINKPELTCGATFNLNHNPGKHRGTLFGRDKVYFEKFWWISGSTPAKRKKTLILNMLQVHLNIEEKIFWSGVLFSAWYRTNSQNQRIDSCTRISLGGGRAEEKMPLIWWYQHDNDPNHTAFIKTIKPKATAASANH